MLMLRSIVSMLLCGLTMPYTVTTYGQDYPIKPIRIITTAPGSGSDIAARIIAQGITVPLGQPVIVENLNSTVVPETLARAVPDGYSITMSASALWLTPLTRKSSYDPLRDFVAITSAATYPYMLVVHPSVPAKSVAELITLANAKPDTLNVGGEPNPGAASFLTAALFKAMTGVKMVNVPYKGTAALVRAVLAGEVEVAFLPTDAGMPLIKSGKLRGLGVTSAQPSSLAPGLPTMASSGLAGYEAVVISGVLGPAGIPIPIVKRLNQEIVRVLNREDVKENLLKADFEVATSSPEQFAATIKSEIVKWGKVLKDAGVKPE